MAPKVFIDINTLVDFFDASRKDHAAARILLQKIEATEADGFVSESVLNTLVYVVRKGFTIPELKLMLAGLLGFIKVLECNNETYLKSLIHPATDIEDAVLYQIAIEHKMDYFITSDKKVFKNFTNPAMLVLTAAEFIKRLTH
jgi:predicted nucleic acid-binding protein